MGMVLAAAWSDCRRLETLVVVTVEPSSPQRSSLGRNGRRRCRSGPTNTIATSTTATAGSGQSLVPPDPVTALFMVMEDGE